MPHYECPDTDWSLQLHTMQELGHYRLKAHDSFVFGQVTQRLLLDLQAYVHIYFYKYFSTI